MVFQQVTVFKKSVISTHSGHQWYSRHFESPQPEGNKLAIRCKYAHFVIYKKFANSVVPVFFFFL